jgi:6,7-dimethyl-8-ribityllumazine synthase
VRDKARSGTTRSGSTRSGERYALVVSRYHESITRRLRQGALRVLRKSGVSSRQIVQIEVPGAFEIPVAAGALAESGRFAAVICLGCVIRGETPHFGYVAEAAAQGVQLVAVRCGVPATFGVLTVDTLEQAMERAGGRAGNKGEEAAQAAIEMAAAMRRIHDMALKVHG